MYTAEEIKSIVDRDFLRSNRFKVIGFGESVDKFCFSANIGGVMVGTFDWRNRGKNIKHANDLIFDQIALGFYNPTDASPYRYFRKWVYGESASVVTSSFELGFYDDIVKDITIIEYAPDGGVGITYKVKNAYPKALSSISLSFENQDAIEKFTVEMSCEEVEIQ